MTQMNLSMKQKQIHRQKTDLWFPRGAIGWEFGISRCKLLYIGWINNTVLHRELHPTSCDKHNGKEYERMCIYVCICTNVTESLLYSRNQHVKQLYFNKNKFKKIPFPHFFFLLSIHSTRCLLLPREKKPLGRSCGSLLLLVCLDPFLNLPFLLLN